MTDWVFKWRASCKRVVDGDTVDMMLDKGFREFAEERLRLQGINCPEIHGPTKAIGDAATAFTKSWLDAATGNPDPWPFVITTYKGDAFGRYVAVVHRLTDPVSLNDALLNAGHAVPFMIDPNPPVN